MTSFKIWMTGLEALEAEIEDDALMQMSLGVSPETAINHARYKVVPNYEIQLGQWLEEMEQTSANLRAEGGGHKGVSLDLARLDELCARVQGHLKYAK